MAKLTENNKNKTFGEYVLRVPTNCFEKPEVFM